MRPDKIYGAYGRAGAYAMRGRNFIDMAKKSTKNAEIARLGKFINSYLRDFAKAKPMPASEAKLRLRVIVEQSYKHGYEDASKSYGGCTSCYGKGYSTTLEFIEGAEDFGGDGTGRSRLLLMRPCRCARGKAIKVLMQGIEAGSKSACVCEDDNKLTQAFCPVHGKRHK